MSAVNQVTFSKSAFAVTAILAGLVIVGAPACADDADPPGDPAPADTTPPATTVPPAATTEPTSTATPEKKCPSSCTKDSDCANACPAVPGGVQCCDVKAAKCFGSKTATCPAPEPTDPDPTPTY